MIDTEVMRVRYKGNGDNKDFQFPFKLNKATDLLVQTYNEDTAELTTVSNYVVVPTVGEYPTIGGTVHYPSNGVAIGNNIMIIISRNISLLQQDSYERNDTFSVENLEKTYDTIVQEVQQVNDKAERAVKASVSASDTIDWTLPGPIANTVFGWNEDGTRIINKEDPSYYTAQSKQFAEQALQSARDAQNANTEAEGNAENARNSASSAAESEANAANSEDESKGYRDEAEAFAKTAQGASAPAWDENASYHYPDVVAGPDGKTYRATADTNPGERPGESEKWMPLTVDLTSDFWEVDQVGDVMPASIIPYSHGKGWELDGNGNIMPENITEIPGAPDDSWRAATNSEISSVFKEV